jgi:hypothetical protein
MLSERLQILVSPEQRRRLEHEAGRRGTSVGSVVRDAIDARLGATAITQADRIRALEEIRQMNVPYMTPEEIDEIAESETIEDWERVRSQNR